MSDLRVLLPIAISRGVLASGAWAGPRGHSPAEMDRQLLEATIPQLQRLYAGRKYTVAQVVSRHLDRIHRYTSDLSGHFPWQECASAPDTRRSNPWRRARFAAATPKSVDGAADFL